MTTLFTNETLSEKKLTQGELSIRQQMFGQRLSPSTSTVIKSFVDNVFTGDGSLAQDLAASEFESSLNFENPMSEDDWKSSDHFREDLKYQNGMTKESAKILAEGFDERTANELVMSKASGVQTAAGIGVGLISGIFEPKNFTTGLITSLVGGQVFKRIDSLNDMLQTVNKSKNLNRQLSLGQRIRRTSGEAVVASAVMEPSNQRSARLMQSDYTMYDSAFNIISSGLFGAAFEGIPAFIRKKLIKGQRNEVIEELEVATSQLAEGRTINTKAVSLMNRAKKIGGMSEEKNITANQVGISLREDILEALAEIGVSVDSDDIRGSISQIKSRLHSDFVSSYKKTNDKMLDIVGGDAKSDIDKALKAAISDQIPPSFLENPDLGLNKKIKIPGNLKHAEFVSKVSETKNNIIKKLEKEFGQIPEEAKPGIRMLEKAIGDHTDYNQSKVNLFRRDRQDAKTIKDSVQSVREVSQSSAYDDSDVNVLKPLDDVELSRLRDDALDLKDSGQLNENELKLLKEFESLENTDNYSDAIKATIPCFRA